VTRVDAHPAGPFETLTGRVAVDCAGDLNPRTFDPPFSLLRKVQQIALGPGERISPRPHHDLELITLVLQGQVLHEDSLGNHVQNGPGTLQVLSAGNGVVHSEVNVSGRDRAVLLRLWLEPRMCQFSGADYHRLMVPASYGALTLAGPQPPPGGAAVREDFAVVIGQLKPGTILRHPLSGRGGEPRRAYAHSLRGSAMVAGSLLEAGQGRCLDDCHSVVVSAPQGVQILLLDLP
jgi:redox-sensitive bicupin YhaK (pirin superfamily)